MRAAERVKTRCPTRQIRSWNSTSKSLQALLKLAGPKTAPELVKRLDEDLRQVAKVLAAAAISQDNAALRVQTHKLVAISGTIGATRLYELTRDLNESAHAPEGLFPAALLAETEGALAKVILRMQAAKSGLKLAP